MRPILRRTLSLALVVIGLLLDATVGQRNARGEVGSGLPTRLTRRGGLLSRKVFVVTDVELRDPDAAGFSRHEFSQGQGQPCHSWVLFEGTADQGPLRVEVVCPSENGNPSGLALSVTDYTTEAGQGPLDAPAPRGVIRTFAALNQRIALTNDEIFDATMFGSGSGRSPSFIERVWLDNALAIDGIFNARPTFGIAPKTTFGNAQEFVMALIAAAPIGASEYELPDPLHQILQSGASWTRAQRSLKSRAEWDRIKTVDYLFYEATGMSNMPGRPALNHQRLFALDKDRDRGIYVPSRITTKAYAGLTSDARSGAGSGVQIQSAKRRRPVTPALVLSRAAELTSDVLWAEEKGSLWPYCIEWNPEFRCP